jgi:hypothetical protein
MKRQSQVRRIQKWGAAGWWMGSAGVLAVIAGCASMGGLSKDTPPDVKAAAVKERSNARWTALINGNKDEAYKYLSSGTRNLISLEQYKARVQIIGYRSVDIDKVECEPEVCKVGLTVTYDAPPIKGAMGGKGIKGVTTYIEETWVLENGQAWVVWRP